jgi:hypothetical protein
MALAALPEYTPPLSEEMLARQDDDLAVRLLIVQRRLYSRAKRWLGLRWFGMVVIGLAAPVVSVIWQNLAVVSGAVAGLWIFIGRTALVFAQSAATTKAAATQEQFDFHVFGMPTSIERSTLPSMEEFAAIAGPESNLRTVAADENLLDWYHISPNDAGTITVAICQRANAAYSDRLLRTTAIVWGSLTGAWIITQIIVSAVVGISLLTFLVGVLFPVLPAFLDVVEYIAGMRKAARGRGDLARSIEQRLKGNAGAIDGNDLLVWQERMYELRRSAPQVPDMIYRIRRAANERAMKWAASQLSQQARRSGQ